MTIGGWSGAMSLIRRGDYPLPYGTMNRVMSAMPYQEINGVKHPFDERVIVNQIIKGEL